MKLHTFSFTVLLLSVTSPAQSQTSTAGEDTTSANQYFAEAVKLTKESEYDSANFYFEKAAAIYEKAAAQFLDKTFWERWVDSYNYIGDNLQEQAKFKSALGALNHALEIGRQKLGEQHPLVAASYNHIGIVYSMQADYDRAIEYYNKSLAINRRLRGENHPDVARAYNNFGNVIGDKGDLDKANEYYAKALAIRIKLLGENHPTVATTYLNIGISHHLKGDYDKALEFLSTASSILTRHYGERHPRVAVSYNNIGSLHYDTGDYDQALEYHARALAIFLEVYGENNFDVGDSYGNIGNAHAGKGNYQQAIEFYTKSVAILAQDVGENHPFVATRFASIGDAYYQQGEYSRAIEFHQKSLSILLKIHGESHWDVAQAYQELGKTYFAKGDLEKALDYYQKSLVSLAPDFAPDDIYQNPKITKSISEVKLLSGLALKAEAFAAFYSTKSGDLKDLKMSLSTYQLAAELIDKIRSGYKAEGSKLFLGKRASQIYEKAIQTALEVYGLTKDMQYQHMAFIFAEESKASVLLDALQESRARQFAAIPQELLEKEKELRIDLAFYETAIQEEQLKTEERDSVKIREFQDRYFAVKTEYESLIERFEKSYPTYYELKYKTQPVSVDELQSALDDRSALLEYVVGDSSIYIFAVTRTAFDMISIKRDSTFDSFASLLATSFGNVTSKAAYVQSASQLYQMLVKPIAPRIADKPRWVIVPDGGLHQIPFEALLTKSIASSASADYRKLPYLIKAREIAYHLSATLFLHGRKERKGDGSDKGFVGFAPVFSTTTNNGDLLDFNLFDDIPFTVAPKDKTSYLITRNGKHLEPLEYSAQEIQNILAMFFNHGDVYLHRDASEENFKKSSTGYKYVHVATHGFMNGDNPKLSNLAFSQPQDKNAPEDGILYAAETYNLDLDADLLVLSACQTGAGKIVRGEGIIALTRGFLYSGARNIIASLWKVYDQHTSQMMVELYRQILNGKSYSAALQAAKLRMLEKPETAGPQSWAAFVMIGG